MKFLLSLVFALLLLSCGGNATPAGPAPADQLAANDFEALDGWLNGTSNASLTTEQAHSGKFSVKAAPDLSYSLGYNNQLGKISVGRLHKIKVHGWVFLPNDKTTAVLVTEVRQPGAPKSLVWDGTDLLKVASAGAGFNKWVEVTRVVAIPEAANGDSQLLVYLWASKSSEPAYLDDLQLFRVD